MTAVATLLAAIWRTMHSPRWMAALGDEESRTMQLAAAISHALGGGPVPTVAAIKREANRRQRDAVIRDKRRDGASYRALAELYGLSIRQVHRIVNEHEEVTRGGSSPSPVARDNRAP